MSFTLPLATWKHIRALCISPYHPEFCTIEDFLDKRARVRLLKARNKYHPDKVTRTAETDTQLRLLTELYEGWFTLHVKASDGSVLNAIREMSHKYEQHYTSPAPASELTAEEKKKRAFKERCERDINTVCTMGNHLISLGKCKELYTEVAQRARLVTKLGQCDDLAQRQVIGALTANINQTARYRKKFGLEMLCDTSDLGVLLI